VQKGADFSKQLNIERAALIVDRFMNSGVSEQQISVQYTMLPRLINTQLPESHENNIISYIIR